jgi:hypothetical protein
VQLFADHSIPPLSRKMTKFINSLNTTWKVKRLSRCLPYESYCMTNHNILCLCLSGWREL